MKKLLDSKENVVEEMIEGITSVYPHIKRIPGQNVLVRADCRDENVLCSHVDLL